MSIKVTDAYFNSSTGVNKIHTVIWEETDKEKIGVFQIAHGVSEYIERYDDFARFLASQGFVVVGNDHLGHGLSVNSMEELGYIADKDGDVRLVDDMHMLHNIMAKRYPALPYILFGHSLGSFCARVYAADFGQELSALILCGTSELPTSAVLGEEPMKMLAERLDPSIKFNSTSVFGLISKLSNRKSKDETSSLDWLSYNKENIENYEADPLCGFPLTIAGNRDALSLMNTACRPEWASKVPVGLPILLIAGAKDPVGFNGKGVINVCDNLEDAGHRPEIILYPGMKHEILNEIEHEKVYNDILGWLMTVL